MANKISFIIEIKDKFGAASEKIKRGFSGIEKSANKADKAVADFSRKTESRMQNLGKKMAGTGAAMVAATAVPLVGMKKALDQSVLVEDAMQDIGRVTGATNTQLGSFESTLESMSEKLGKSKVGLAQMAFEGGKLGVALEDMEPFLMMVSKTAIAFDMADQEAGRAIGSIQAKMGLAREDTMRLLDSVNFLADTTSASGERMINVLERTSGTMNLLEVPPEAAAAMAGFADQIEVTSELAASGLNMFMNRMQRIPGMTTQMMTDPLGSVQGMLTEISAMGPEVQTQFIKKVFGDEAGRFVKKMVSNVDLFDKTIKNAFSEESVGSMSRELENQLQRSSKVFQQLNETSSNTFASIGDALKPVAVTMAQTITPMVDAFGKFVEDNPKFVEFAGTLTLITAAVGGLAIAAGGLAAAFALVSAPVLIAAAAVLAIGAAVTAVMVFWDDLKIKLVEFTNFMIEKINMLITPLSKISEFLGAGAIEIQAIKIPDIEVDNTPVDSAPLGKVEDIIGKIQGQIEVVAGPGTAVNSTSMATSGPGLDIGMNMVP